MGELFVSMCVMAKGGQILRNLSPSGDTDLVIRIGRDMIPVDVKVSQYRKSSHSDSWYWSAAALSRVPDYIYPVIVTPHNGTDFQSWAVDWGCRYGKTPRCPEGLDNFWSKDYILNPTQPTTDAA